MYIGQKEEGVKSFMGKFLIVHRKVFFLLVLHTLFCACSEKNMADLKPKDAYIYAKSFFDDGNHRIAVTKLSEFRSRFPYSQYATEADFLIADSHFQMGEYAMASAEYTQLVKLHPKHPKIDFARYRIGLSYWEAAPESLDREQEFTRQAIESWGEFLENHPQSSLRNEVLEKIAQGKSRLQDSEEFVAEFYKNQEIWHACAFRYENLFNMVTQKQPKIAKRALQNAAECLENLASQQLKAEKHGKQLRLNVYSKNYTVPQMREYSNKLRLDAAKIN